MWGGGRKKNENATGVGGTPGSSRANPIRKEEKRFSRKVTGSIESGRGDVKKAVMLWKKRQMTY